MNRVLQIGLITLVICLSVLGVAVLGTFLYARYGGGPSHIRALEERVQKLESREGCRIHTWYETIATSGTNGVLQLTNGMQVQTFGIRRPGPYEPGWFSEAWVVECEPRTEILKFDEFTVKPYKEGVIVSARQRTNEAVSMR